MGKKHRFAIFFALLLILISGTVSHAAISRPKNFRIVYQSDKGTVLESFEWSVYAVQQVFLDKMNISTYIDPKGYEYKVSGYRLKTWSGTNYSGKASEDVSSSYSGIVTALRKAYDTLDAPYSLQATLVMKATGNKFSTDIPVHVIWLNQDNEFVKEEVEYLGRDGTYTDKPPKEYQIISIDAMMTDIWNVGSEVTINPKAPTVRYNKFAKEYKIVYRLQLTPEQESRIMGEVSGSSEEETAESTAPDESTAPAESTVSESSAGAAETTAAEETGTQQAGSTSFPSDPAQTETVVIPSQTDESFKTGSNRTTLIIGLVIGIVVIYLIVISIGTNSKNKPKRKSRL